MGSVGILRKIPGFESYDEQTDILLSLKASTGTVGAPRAFSLKLAKITQGPPFYLAPLSRDPEVEVSHLSGLLRLAICKHIDDITCIGLPRDISLFKETLESVFGKLKYHEKSLTNTGIVHNMSPDGSISMSQTSYIQGIQPMSRSSLVGRPPEDEVDPATTTEFKSVLGAIAYAMMTQFHLLIYVVALQRKSHKPLVLHCRKLNALLAHMQKQPRELT